MHRIPDFRPPERDLHHDVRVRFFETDHNIRSYLRSSCLSDLHLSGKERISFSTRAVDMVSMMDAKEPVLIKRIDEGDKKYYSIELEKTKLKKAVNDDCIHSP